MKKVIICIFTVIFLFPTCIEPFDPEIDKYENLLVIDGLVSNQTGPNTVKLSRTSNIENTNFLAERGAQVIIYDNSGNSEILNETSAGIYKTSGNEIQGIIGRHYKLYIKTKDNNEYESDFVELLEPVEIDTLYEVVEFQETEEAESLTKGYQFYIESQSSSNETINLLWETIETYEFNAEYIIEEIWDIQEQEFLPYPNPFEFYTCYRTNRINNIFILKVNENDFNAVAPLYFVSEDTEKLIVKYSLLVNQYTIDNTTYSYWNNQKKILTQGNSLYNTQPFQVASNIKNLNTEKEPIIGYFTVAGISQKRIFVDPMRPFIIQPKCVPDTTRYKKVLSEGSWSNHFATTDRNGNMGLIIGDCIFCINNGVLEKPDYWDDDNQ